jgi:hypothetical protein
MPSPLDAHSGRGGRRTPAGNSATDSCGIVPANVPEAITVAASNLPSKFSSQRLAGVMEDLYRCG